WRNPREWPIFQVWSGRAGIRRQGGGMMKVEQIRKKFASSIDVARLAGVSQSAVSRTFTPGASVSAKTRKKVIAAAEELGYQPSIIPKIMLTQRSALVAIVIG